MESSWSDADAKACVDRYHQQGVGEDLALRVYTTRLLGREPRLVLHGGGNTSVKTRMADVLGDEVEVLCVKGSGWDMAEIEPEGLPAVRLEPIRRLAELDSLSDEAMVNAQRCNLIDSASPNPSVETLLHAFLPHKFIDHTHANAVLALTDQPDGEQICAELYGDRAALVPYIMPGFDLAQAARRIQAAHPDCEGLVLLKHGIFTFGDTARDAYERMIEFVTMAERRANGGRPASLSPIALPDKCATAAEVAPILRGAAAILENGTGGPRRRFIAAFRAGPAILDYVNGRDLDRYARAGVATPDHVIRTRPKPLLLPPAEARRLDAFAETVRQAAAAYAADYHAYFERNNRRQESPRIELDPAPRVMLVPGLGLFTLGNSARAAGVAADIAEATIDVVTAAEGVGRFESVSEADLFDVEYWSLEQAKLGKAADRPLAGHVVVVTGGGGGIGAATAAAFRAEGAEVAVLDRDGDAASTVAARTDGLSVECDVTDPVSVAAAFDRVCEAFGGVDIAVSNAGAAWQGRIGDVPDEILRESFELNFFAHQTVARRAVAIMRKQGTGGSLLFNASKQALNPGPDFGPYGLPKAATLNLMRQYAIDYGSEGIRANAVNADRIRSGLLTDEMIRSRAKARGLSERDYMGGNLLHREVRAEDVARAFVALALSERTTGAIFTVDGGNIAAAPR